VLRTLDDFRAFSTILGKKFGTIKSTKDALSNIMIILASMDLNSIREAIAKVPIREGDEEDAFRRFANQIISGSANTPPDG